MAVRTYRQWALENTPPWLRGTWGEQLVNALGGIFDEARDMIYQAGAAGSVDAPTFPNDALGVLGNERNIERYPAENDSQYKARVKGAWESWSQAGTMRLVAEIAYLGPTAVIKENFTSGWNWDGDSNNWSSFWPVITNHGWSFTTWGQSGLKWGNQRVWGCDATPNDAATLLRLIRKWKPAHAFPITVVVMNTGSWNSNQPDGTWGNPANRSAAALYHYER